MKTNTTIKENIKKNISIIFEIFVVIILLSIFFGGTNILLGAFLCVLFDGFGGLLKLLIALFVIAFVIAIVIFAIMYIISALISAFISKFVNKK